MRTHTVIILHELHNPMQHVIQGLPVERARLGGTQIVGCHRGNPGVGWGSLAPDVEVPSKRHMSQGATPPDG